MSKQPEWEFVANLGDVTPLDYGGAFLYRDKTGVYDPQLEILVEPGESQKHYTLYRFDVEPCTYQDGVLSDNPSHPNQPAWFDNGVRELEQIADYQGMSKFELITAFLAQDIRERARAWITVGEYYGWINLDSYPLTLDTTAVKAHYKQGELG